MDEPLRVEKLQPADDLQGNQSARFMSKFSFTKESKRLETGPEHVHDHNVVLTFAPIVCGSGDPIY